MGIKGTSKYCTNILKLHNEGKKYKEICEILDCCTYTVWYWLNENGKLFSKKEKEDILSTKWCLSKGQLRNREYVNNHLKTHSCIDCGNSDIRVLEFDHVRGTKTDSISQAVRRGWKMESLIVEIEKCEVRCCNCHRIVTRQRRFNNI